MIKNEWEKYAISHLGINSNTLTSYEKFNNKEITNLTPYILEERQLRVSQMDIFSRLMMDRIIFLGEGINDQVANIVTGQLLFLESVDPKKDIQLYLNSPGGSVYAGLGIYDVMQLIKPDVATINTGMAASMGAILMVAGAKGKRSALKHSRVLLHQPMGGVASGTQESDIQITAREIGKLKKELYDIIVFHTGKTYEEVERNADRDFWLTASEAQDYGIVDEILSRATSK